VCAETATQTANSHTKFRGEQNVFLVFLEQEMHIENGQKVNGKGVEAQQSNAARLQARAAKSRKSRKRGRKFLQKNNYKFWGRLM
jgi:hypothetical protein